MVRGCRRRNRRRAAGVRLTANAARAARSAASVEEERSPLRRCIVTGEVRERGALVRLVVDPDGAIVPDIEGRLPGRGLWLTARRDIVDRAVAKRAFARAARRPVSASPELADRIESLLARRCVDLLGLARRAGIAVAGFDRVGEALRRGKVGLLLGAQDGAAASRDKLAALAHNLPSVGVLTAAELGTAFGRERIVHAAIGGGTLCRRLMEDLSRLAGLREAAAGAGGSNLASAAPTARHGGTETE